MFGNLILVNIPVYGGPSVATRPSVCTLAALFQETLKLYCSSLICIVIYSYLISFIYRTDAI